VTPVKGNKKMKSQFRSRLLPIVILSFIAIVGISGCDRLMQKSQPKSALTQATEQLYEYAKEESHVYDAALAQQFAATGQSGIDQLLILLKDQNPKVRAQAAYLLGEMNVTSAVPALTVALSDGEYYVQNEAVRALSNMGKAAQPAVDRLIGSKESRHPRSSSIDLLSELGEVAVPSLIKSLADPQIDSKLFVITALGNMESTAKPAAPRLIATLKHPNSKVRVQAAWALVKTQTAKKQALPILIAALQDPDEDMRSRAIQTLGTMGSDAKPAVPKLLNLLQPARPTNGTIEQTQSAQALAGIGGFPELIATLNSPDPLVRWRVAYALRGVKDAAAPAMPALIKALKDPDRDVRLHTIRALKSIDKSAEAATSELEIVARQDPDWDVRETAAEAIKCRRSNKDEISC
jgi:HEAT repeat protein